MSLASRISKCCKAPIVRISKIEYPLDRTYYINLSAESCLQCGNEWPETIEQCDCCGEGFEFLTETKLGMWCKECCITYAEDLVERIKEAYS